MRWRNTWGSYDDSIEFVRVGERLEINVLDAAARCAWERNSRKLGIARVVLTRLAVAGDCRAFATAAERQCNFDSCLRVFHGGYSTIWQSSPL